MRLSSICHCCKALSCARWITRETGVGDNRDLVLTIHKLWSRESRGVSGACGCGFLHLGVRQGSGVGWPVGEGVTKPRKGGGGISLRCNHRESGRSLFGTRMELGRDRYRGTLWGCFGSKPISEWDIFGVILYKTGTGSNPVVGSKPDVLLVLCSFC